MPKLYFYDTGLVSELLGIENHKQLELNSFRGALFENFVILDLIKKDSIKPNHLISFFGEIARVMNSTY